MTKPNRRPLPRKKHSKAVKRALKLTTLILAHDFVSAAHGQSTNTAPSAAEGTNAPSQKLPDVVVTGEKESYKTDDVALPKLTEPLRDTPQSITVVPREVMQDQNTTTLRDVLRNVAGISIAAGEGGSQGDNLTLRGFTARNDIFLDGMRDFGSYYRDPFNYESVDVLQGPASVMFGRGSTGGIINQESKTPGLSPFVDGTLTLGTDNTRRATADINEPLPELGKNTAVRLNLMGNDSQLAGRDIGENRRFGIAPSIAFGVGTPTTLTLSYLHQSEDDIPDYGLPWLKIDGRVAPVDRSNFYGFKSDYLRTDVDMVSAKLEHQVNEHITLRDQARWANYSRDFRITEPQVPTVAAPLDTITVTRNQLAGISKETYLWDQLDATVDFNTGPVEHTLVAGGEGGRETSDPTRFTYQGVPTTSLLFPNENQNFSSTNVFVRSKTQATATSFGFYAMDTMKFGEHWEVAGGIRWDYFDADFHDSLANAPTNRFNQTVTKPSWRGALVYKPVEKGSIYFTYGTSWNPSAESLSLSAGNHDIAPEDNETFEFGTKWDLLQNRLSVRGSIFRTEKDNARETDPTPGSTLVVDGGKQRVDGFELALSGRVTKEWQVFASYDYLDSEVLDSKFFPNAVGRSLNNVPRNTFSLWTTYELPLNFEVGGGLNVVSSRTANTATLGKTTVPERVDGYWTLNAMVKYKVSHRLTAQVNVYNLTDNYYIDQIHPSHAIPGAGISALFSTSFTF